MDEIPDFPADLVVTVHPAVLVLLDFAGCISVRGL